MIYRIQKILLWRSFYFSAALLGGLTMLYSIAEFRISDWRYEYKLRKNHFAYEAEVQYHETPERTLRYLEIGDDTKPLIVFIHGAPGSSAFWQRLLPDSSLLAHAKLLAVDRPGYGYSGYGKPITDVAEHSRLIGQIIEEKSKQHETIILHGSSYGGTVSARIAMDYPHLIDGLLLQSASLKSGAEKTYPISYPTSHWLLRWAVPGSLKVANAEKLSHHQSLDAMAPLWPQIKAHTIVLQGTADGLIYPENAPYAYEQLHNAKSRQLQMIDGRGHDLLWTRTQLLKDSLLELVRLAR